MIYYIFAVACFLVGVYLLSRGELGTGFDFILLAIIFRMDEQIQELRKARREL